jgi:2-polyprenyl-6-hydroxyphenyl methylase/3-demethylubiquinone-9 3-methyltransferase
MPASEELECDVTDATVDPEEIGRFARQADDWWDPEGGLGVLHRLNPVRLAFIRAELCRHFHRDSRSLRPFQGLDLVDIGCGGGLVAEPMARLGFAVTGIDAGAAAIAAARLHAENNGLAIDQSHGARFRAGGRRRRICSRMAAARHP